LEQCQRDRHWPGGVGGDAITARQKRECRQARGSSRPGVSRRAGAAPRQPAGSVHEIEVVHQRVNRPRNASSINRDWGCGGDRVCRAQRSCWQGQRRLAEGRGSSCAVDGRLPGCCRVCNRALLNQLGSRRGKLPLLALTAEQTGSPAPLAALARRACRQESPPQSVRCHVCWFSARESRPPHTAREPRQPDCQVPTSRPVCNTIVYLDRSASGRVPDMIYASVYNILDS